MKHERRATWLELFFDLIFVGAVAIYAHSLGEHFTLITFIKSIPIFMAIWFIWINYSYYYDLFDAGLWGNWISIGLSAFIMLFFIASVGHAVQGDMVYFIFWYGVIRINLSLVNLFKYVFSLEEHRIFFLVRGIAYGLFGLIFFIALWTVSTQNLYLTFVILFILDYLLPYVTTAQIQKYQSFYEYCEQKINNIYFIRAIRQQPTEIPITHLQERHGLFILIAIGENITVAANVINKIHFSGTLFIEAFMFFGTAYWMMLIFFSRIRSEFFGHLAKQSRYNMAMIAGYAHLGIAYAFTLYSVGILMLLTEHNTLIGYYVTYGAVIGFFIVVTLLQNLWRPLSIQTMVLRGITCSLLILWMIIKPDVLWATIALYFSVWVSPLVSIIHQAKGILSEHKANKRLSKTPSA